MGQVNCIGPHEYSFRDGILSFAPRGLVLPEHAAELVGLFEQHGHADKPLLCLFDLSRSLTPTPGARLIVVEFLRRVRPRLVIATQGAPLRLRAMLALV